MKRMPVRFRAGLIHLACSAAVAGTALALIYFVWYYGALAELQGVDHLVLILIGVDVTLGPLLTTIIFNPTKARHLLRFDLSLIATVQLAALIYGLHTVFIARPVYIVFNTDRFTIVTAQEVIADSLDRARRQGGADLPWGRPRLVASRLPQEPKAREALMFLTLETGTDVPQYPEWYVPYASDVHTVVQRARDLGELEPFNASSHPDWEKFRAEFTDNQQHLGYLPVVGKARDGVALVDGASGRLVKILSLEPPWKQG